MGDFVHLHVHSQYSFLDSSIRIPKLVERVKELGMSAVALTDHDSMMGAVDFYKAGRAAEIRPILGCEPTVALKDARDPKDTARYQIVLLARNQEGYRNLCRLSHLAHEALDAVGHARLDPRSLAEHAGGLVLLTGGLAGDIPQLLLHGEHAEARERLRFYRDALGPEHVFVELQDHGIVAGGNSDGFGDNWPITGIAGCVTRRSSGGDYLCKEQAISIMDAIKAYTLNGAYLEGTEKVKGSLEPGKLADMVVLDRDVTSIDPLDIINTEALMTIVGGEVVYERES